MPDDKAREAINLLQEFNETGETATKDFVRAEIRQLETRMATKMYWIGIGQIMVILGGLIAIIKFTLIK